MIALIILGIVLYIFMVGVFSELFTEKSDWNFQLFCNLMGLLWPIGVIIFLGQNLVKMLVKGKKK